MKSFFSLCILAVLAAATEHQARQASSPAVITATRVVHAVVDQSPFLVESTSTIVWTQSPSVTNSQPAPTDIPTDIPSSISVTVPANISAILSA
ncbi:hypothetical protein P691DRAFT_807676 [Macrolepiota fuliginosa MF-IS2]|uniref:Uncharacterized protein n=1 Tax=Macrolepiota fuliginosa MF-IS2 TaxID=1400762 RepID=A0A9P5X3Q3_9AGAR|nr:hypothetical protein P691DRAFT_807676 [Macrolepiota fuliginosa MF-IS2]